MSELIIDDIVTLYVSPDFDDALPSIALDVSKTEIKILVRNTEDYIGLNQCTKRGSVTKEDVVKSLLEYMHSLSTASLIYESPYIAMFVRDAQIAEGYRKYLSVMAPTQMESSTQYWLQSILPASIAQCLTVSVVGDRFLLELEIDEDTTTYELNNENVLTIFNGIGSDDGVSPLPVDSDLVTDIILSKILGEVRKNMNEAKELIDEIVKDLILDGVIDNKDSSDEESI